MATKTSSIYSGLSFEYTVGSSKYTFLEPHKQEEPIGKQETQKPSPEHNDRIQDSDA